MNTAPIPTPRPRSPWSGSHHETLHRWQLDDVLGLDEVAGVLTALAAELAAAHDAGWRLVAPLRDGRLEATRPSRRQRHDDTDGPPAVPAALPSPPWRVRVVDERAVPGLPVLDATLVDATPVLAWSGASFEHVGGPRLGEAEADDLLRQLDGTGLRAGWWGVARARVGPNLDLVAHGSALRVHAVRRGALVRTSEALLLSHAADGATHLLQAAAAYDALAATAVAMAAGGGRLSDTDDGLVQVTYDDEAR